MADEIERLQKRLADPCYAALWDKTEEVAQLNLALENDAKRLAWHDETLAERDAEIERLSKLVEELTGDLEEERQLLKVVLND
jgi:uncharacterized protein YhaN